MIRDTHFWKRSFIAALALPLAAAGLLARPSGAGFSLRVLASPRSPEPPARASKPAGATPVFSADKGKLRITINGQTVGAEDFEISPSGDAWIERSSMSAHAPGGVEIKAEGQLQSCRRRRAHPL